jgi:hypothetical protein
MTQDNKPEHEIFAKLDSIKNSYEESFSFVGSTEENLLELLLDRPTIVFKGLLKFLQDDIQSIDFVFKTLFLYKEAYTTPIFLPINIEELNVLIKYLLENPGMGNLTSAELEFVYEILRFNHLIIESTTFEEIKRKVAFNKELKALLNNPEPNIEFLKQIVNVRVEG